jgi:hypothetical protein
MKEIVCLVARMAFLILVVACVVVAYVVMTGQKWQSPKPKPEPKKAATKTTSDQRKSVCGTQGLCDAVKMNGPFFPNEHFCGGMDLTVFLNVPFSPGRHLPGKESWDCACTGRSMGTLLCD